jgi:hypothetical protein
MQSHQIALALSQAGIDSSNRTGSAFMLSSYLKLHCTDVCFGDKSMIRRPIGSHVNHSVAQLRRECGKSQIR